MQGDLFSAQQSVLLRFQCNSVVFALLRGVYCRVDAPLHVEEIRSSDSCSIGTDFHHVMEFSLSSAVLVYEMSSVPYALA